MTRVSGREREAKLIRQANRAAAVGRLMLGELRSWHEFLEADLIDLKNLPRRQLKSGHADVKERLSEEIKSFCSKNFDGMKIRNLSDIYEEIKANRGFEIPLIEFEERFAKVRRKVLQGNPAHLTICISLWGLQFKFPEDELAKDIINGLRLGSEAKTKLNKFERLSQPQIEKNRDEINSLMRKKNFAARSTITSCFNLMEAYLNGLAWDFIQIHGTDGLSKRKKTLLDDSVSASIRDKLLKYPEIITGRVLWNMPDMELNNFIDIIKPFRDSLVHPSPFSAPERFGGYDKLLLFYRIDFDIAEMTVNLLINIIERIHKHVHGKQSIPIWMEEFIENVKGVYK